MGFKTMNTAVLWLALLPGGCARAVSTWSPEVVPLGMREVRSEAAVKQEVIALASIAPEERHLLRLQVTRVKHCEGWQERAYREDRVEHHIDPHEGSRGYTCLLLPAAAALGAAGGVMLGAGLSHDDSTSEEEDKGQGVTAGGGILLGLSVAMAALCPIDLFWPATSPRGRRKEGAVYTKKGKPFTFTCGREPYAEGLLEVELPRVPTSPPPTEHAPGSQEQGAGIAGTPLQRRTDKGGVARVDLLRWLAETWSVALPEELLLRIKGQRVAVPLTPELRAQAVALVQQTPVIIAGGETHDFWVTMGPGKPLLHRAHIQCKSDLRLAITVSFVPPEYSLSRRHAPFRGARVVKQPPYALGWRGASAGQEPLGSWVAGTATVSCGPDDPGTLQVRGEPRVLQTLKFEIKASPSRRKPRR